MAFGFCAPAKLINPVLFDVGVKDAGVSRLSGHKTMLSQAKPVAAGRQAGTRGRRFRGADTGTGRSVR